MHDLMSFPAAAINSENLPVLDSCMCCAMDAIVMIVDRFVMSVVPIFMLPSWIANTCSILLFTCAVSGCSS